jgi:hypothetical protein
MCMRCHVIHGHSKAATRCIAWHVNEADQDASSVLYMITTCTWQQELLTVCLRRGASELVAIAGVRTQRSQSE